MVIEKFASQVKTEIQKQMNLRVCCGKIALRTFLTLTNSAGTLLRFKNPSMARFLIGLLQHMQASQWGMGISAKREGYIVLSQIPFLSRVDFKKEFFQPCCRRSVLQMMFVMRGSLSLPKHGYHLEIQFRNKPEAVALERLLKEEGIPLNSYLRRKKWVGYLKNGDLIASFLARLGASTALLRFEEWRALKDTKNQVRRRVNYESANLERTARAALRQAEKIGALLKRRESNFLPAALREAAVGRLENPELSLDELSRKLGISRSALNHRLRRLERIR